MTQTFASVLLNYQDLQLARKEQEEWAKTHFVPSVTHYCSKCHQITTLVHPDYPADPVSQLIVSDIMRQNYTQTMPAGQGTHES